MQRKVEGAPNVEATMEAVKQLRGEKEKQKELLAQRTEQRVVIQQADQRINRLEQQLKDIRAAAVGTTPEALLQKIEEETKVNTYIGNNVNNLKKALPLRDLLLRTFPLCALLASLSVQYHDRATTILLSFL